MTNHGISSPPRHRSHCPCQGDHPGIQEAEGHDVRTKDVSKPVISASSTTTNMAKTILIVLKPIKKKTPKFILVGK
jgi:hypothetical protein